MLIAATNHENLLDSAIWRRFPLKLEMELPDKSERMQLFKFFLHDWKDKVDLSLFADITEGMSGSDIENAVMGAKRSSLISKDDMDDSTLIKSLVTSGVKVGTKKRSKDKLYKIATKLVESGHTLKDASRISGVPYTTLRDNIKVQS